jgi:hypothetical protein
MIPLPSNLVLVTATKLSIASDTTSPRISRAPSTFLAAALDALAKGILVSSACDMVS